ncbi:hypothetical protein G7046_g7793 [Stylonectria norvegica]|nr:hypothetical protein G7046_g7793 [Stylonectria norvegica]
MPKERNYNPVQAQHKADKAKTIRKGKAEKQGRLNERLAKKNPDRLQKQIDDLKAVATSGGKLTRHEEQVLEGLEKELKAVKKARDTLGDKAPELSRGWMRQNDSHSTNANSMVLGKRRRGSDASSSGGDRDVDEEARKIPMPRDTPPPIPKEILDEWYSRRRAKRNAEMAARQQEEGLPTRQDAPVVEQRTVYEAKPVIRDLRKEAVTAFVPTAVKIKLDKGQGRGGLLEPEEADRLEKEGYLKTIDDGGANKLQSRPTRNATVEEDEDDEE